MDITDTLRARFRPEWKGRADLTGLDTMLENALSFVTVPKAKKDELEKLGTLNPRGVSEAMLVAMGKAAAPELRRTLKVVAERREALKRERATLAKPNIDKADAAAAVMRSEMRTYLRGLDMGERARVLITNPDPIMLAAVLEAPDALSGLNADTRAHVETAYVEANHADKVKAMADHDEALSVVAAAVGIAQGEMRKHVGIGPQAFADWFTSADGTETRRAA